ncbi:MAG: hypothetical protein HY287_04865 [Planctomycetes bacterium]|nr:hypothetical protein [Planctomycetota bacterium]MBI3833645.1 hypothetical protein [Planctomycetota bacterium]
MAEVSNRCEFPTAKLGVKRSGIVVVTCALALLTGPVHARAAHCRVRPTIGAIIATQMPAVSDCTVDASVTCPAAAVASFSIFPLAMVACEVAPRIQARIRVSLVGGLHGP